MKAQIKNREIFPHTLGNFVHSCTNWLRPRNPPPPAFGLIYEGPIGQPRQTTSLCDPPSPRPLHSLQQWRKYLRRSINRNVVFIYHCSTEILRDCVYAVKVLFQLKSHLGCNTLYSEMSISLKSTAHAQSASWSPLRMSSFLQMGEKAPFQQPFFKNKTIL